MKYKNTACVIAVALIGCVAMAIVDGIIMPHYAVKSAIKLVFFLLVPLICSVLSRDIYLKEFLSFNKKGIIWALALGLTIYSLILGGYFLLKNVFDFSSVVSSLSENVGVNKSNFLFISIYIALANSFLEELFFRGFIFGNLKKQRGRAFSYIFSALAFALYHIALMTGWFSIGLTLLLVLGLMIGGAVFNYLTERFETICLPWAVHMFANFAINTIGFILMADT